MIKAPYNFVPLSQEVVFPDWGSKISIDRPFEDGISGTIDVKYTAQTPVFIGNGKDNNNSSVKNYKSANGKYAIPGSSLRGMLRNIVEIISFGKLNRVSDAALSVRDLQNPQLYSSHLTIDRGNKRYEALSKAGWLVYENNEWVLYKVDYHRVEDSVLEQCYNLNSGILKKRNELDRRIGFIRGKTSVYFSVENIKEHRHHDGMTLIYSKVDNIKKQSFSSAKHGFVVLTGQPGRQYSKKYDREIGKHLDFVFEDKGTSKVTVDYSTILQFKQANTPKAADQKKGLDLTKKLKECITMGYPGIPVFYLPNKDGTPNSLGLSQMYRLPYKNSLHDAIKHSSEENFSDKLDFAECIFGKIKDTKKRGESIGNFSLRGRVQFEDAATDNGTLASRVDTILGNPKPTYYPNYIQQNNRNPNYKTLMDNDVKLNGWKRYPVKNKINPVPIGQDQERVGTHFTPLQKGTVFEGKIHFHNLKKEELGVLLWAITWGDDKNLSHAVGMGKSYGFGQIKAEIASLSYLNNNADDNVYQNTNVTEWNNWMDTFTKYMEGKVVNWGNCPQLTELKAMANPKNAERSSWSLSHMSLGASSRDNEFVLAKNKNIKAYLARYSENNQQKSLVGGNSNCGGCQRNNGNQNFRSQSPQKVNTNNGAASSNVQMCILMEEKTKKGGWKAQLKNNQDVYGPITNSENVPQDKKAGDEILLRIISEKGNNSSFKYEEKLK
ncbi:MAG: TIGR03986 family CRISPR-associated RAMP protein [Spirochaetales bacterium]|nr:TIGR03986 family CRISPR-associated RAMP protein [Spirochaetales bacterium]